VIGAALCWLFASAAVVAAWHSLTIHRDHGPWTTLRSLDAIAIPADLAFAACFGWLAWRCTRPDPVLAVVVGLALCALWIETVNVTTKGNAHAPSASS
jgi:hypothetical protein